MTTVVVAGVREPLTERLAAGLSEVAGGCRRLAAESLAEAGEIDTLVVPALAGVDLRGVPDEAAAGRACEHAAAAGVRHLILISSAAVHEPNHHHPGHVAEDRRTSQRRGNLIAGAWRELEATARRALAGSETALTVLRPAAVVARGGSDYFSRLFAGRWAFVLPGYDPSLQLLAPDDLTAAVVRLAERGPEAAGVYHLAPRGVMPLRKALKAACCRRLPMPRSLHRLARKVLGRRAAPIDQLDYVRYPWTVSAGRIRRELDFEPLSSSVRAVRGAAQRSDGRQEGADEFDDFGLDKDYVARLGRTLFRFLHDFWWRVEWRGLEHVPRHGRAVLAGVHRGHQPWDGVMTLHLLVRELGRYPRFLVHPTLVKFPFLAPYMVKCGGIHACRENAAWVLEREGLLAIFPEGIRGAFCMYRDAYKLGKFGRDEYVKIALTHQAPIIPYVTVGSAEIFPIYGRIDWKWWQRTSEWPFLPITPTMSTVPLPSKWHTRFLEPIDVGGYPPEAAGDREVVAAISAQVRARMEAAIAEMLERRKSIWWGSVFDQETVVREEAA